MGAARRAETRILQRSRLAPLFAKPQAARRPLAKAATPCSHSLQRIQGGLLCRHSLRPIRGWRPFAVAPIRCIQLGDPLRPSARPARCFGILWTRPTARLCQ